ncbi:hypothetical protein ABZ990_01685 [Streptomyces sp. NPDC046203]|uniref:hypothetical protein n=1 Tax=Streptomyces sp. NPDC046203 TaxID=3154602 RepID=UPI0033F0232F
MLRTRIVTAATATALVTAVFLGSAVAASAAPRTGTQSPAATAQRPAITPAGGDGVHEDMGWQ